jgi:hypothetical protein
MLVLEIQEPRSGLVDKRKTRGKHSKLRSEFILIKNWGPSTKTNWTRRQINNFYFQIKKYHFFYQSFILILNLFYSFQFHSKKMHFNFISIFLFLFHFQI